MLLVVDVLSEKSELKDRFLALQVEGGTKMYRFRDGQWLSRQQIAGENGMVAKHFLYDENSGKPSLWGHSELELVFSRPLAEWSDEELEEYSKRVPPLDRTTPVRMAGDAIEVRHMRTARWPVANTDTTLFEPGHVKESGIDPYKYVQENEDTVIAVDYSFNARHRLGGIHKGVDLFAPRGTEITAPVDGTVRRAGWGSEKSGWRVWIEGADGNWYLLGHMNVDPTVFVREGQEVFAGSTKIGEVGDSGSAKDACCHVHFEIRKGSQGGRALDPHEVVGAPY